MEKRIVNEIRAYQAYAEDKRLLEQDGRNRGPHTHAQGPFREPRGSKYTYEKVKIVKRRILYRNVREPDAINLYAVCFYKILVKLFSKPYANATRNGVALLCKFLIVPILIFDFYYLLGETSFIWLYAFEL